MKTQNENFLFIVAFGVIGITIGCIIAAFAVDKKMLIIIL